MLDSQKLLEHQHLELLKVETVCQHSQGLRTCSPVLAAHLRAFHWRASLGILHLEAFWSFAPLRAAGHGYGQKQSC